MEAIVKKGGFFLCLLSLLALNGFAQEAVPLTTALNSSVPYLISQIPADSKVLVLNITADTLPYRITLPMKLPSGW
jgi:hypothetical protein